MLKAYNKWNKHTYEVIEKTDKSVTMKRENGSVFTIQLSEYNFTYIEK